MVNTALFTQRVTSVLKKGHHLVVEASFYEASTHGYITVPQTPSPLWPSPAPQTHRVRAGCIGVNTPETTPIFSRKQRPISTTYALDTSNQTLKTLDFPAASTPPSRASPIMRHARCDHFRSGRVIPRLNDWGSHVTMA